MFAVRHFYNALIRTLIRTLIHTLIFKTVQKKLFRINPTPLHQHPMYSFNSQQLAAFLNIRKPYTNPTLTLHPNLNFPEIQVNL